MKSQKTILEDATDEEIIQEINNRLRIHCDNCGGSGRIIYNAFRADARSEVCEICYGTGLKRDPKRALEIKHKIGKIFSGNIKRR